MKLGVISRSAILALTLTGAAASRADRAPIAPEHGPIAMQAALHASPISIPASLQSKINAAIAACHCFSSVTPWQVAPVGTPAQVFASADILSDLVGQDAQLPWAPAGEINAAALSVRLAPSGQKGVLVDISSFADPSGGGFRLGAWKWSHPTAPDFCSGETLYLQYFPVTGKLFAWRFDSSSEC